MDRSLLTKAPCCYNCKHMNTERQAITGEIRFYYCALLHLNSEGWHRADDTSKVHVDNICPFYEGYHAS